MNAPELTTIRSAPKVLLHDHLDGGLRPETVLELAEQCGYDELPANTASELAQWFRTAADSGSLELYLETFAHTVAVMQTPPKGLHGWHVSVPRIWPTTTSSMPRSVLRPSSTWNKA